MDINELGRILGQRFHIVAGDGAIALKELALPAGANVLDVGTGAGNFAIFLASQGYQVLTGEPSTDASRYARQDWTHNARKAGLLDRIRFQAFDASQMPFESGAFDAVFFFGVLHHIAEEIRGDVLREALRVSKEKGPVVFFEPRPIMLEKVRGEDPGHPPAADPSRYLTVPQIDERRIAGAYMDISIYRKATPSPLAPATP